MSIRSTHGAAGEFTVIPAPKKLRLATIAVAAAAAAAAIDPKVTASSTSLSLRKRRRVSGPASVSTKPTTGSSSPFTNTCVLLPLSISARPVGARAFVKTPTAAPAAPPHTSVSTIPTTGWAS